MATMDELFRNSIQQAGLLKKPSSLIPWKADEPWPQPYYQWDIDSEVWQPIKQLASPVKDQAPSISTISLYSWNIDFMLPAAEARMNAALAHLEEATSQLPSTTAAVINLQMQSFGPHYFDRRLQISSCFRVHFSATQMERDALFVDVTMPVTSRKLRLADTHLESLALDPPLRPSQMRLAAKYLQDGEGLAGAIIAGDFNAIQPFDASLHSDNNLHDAYLDLGGREDSEDGFTWGQQALPALRERFGCSRMDKAFFCGTGIRLQAFERFGIDVEIDESKKKQRDRLLALGFGKAWVTDHLGIKATFAVVNDTRL
ncbi:endonuclease/exonuclease/phosphatase family protein [Pochonia chlamydosporia 170]|uniref:Endonuclease/exonuclease/phosphatase family protein n=1 Tax=Pochonia chlamydosporia 170 TaxID=1380566 RepID=A0A179F166_METCM|nr:endonuclease/exonuclease/phosphatase family protein [Pochonia chlamydosporia 170]OAQ59148.2 endonuclease/exonuclease/phosphatase family protein [Pochonia chlamydosporia 170]